MTKPKIDKTLVGWSAKLRALGLERDVARYDTDIVRDFYLVHELGLPRYDSHMIPCTQFLDEFEHFQNDFIHDSYYLVLLPKYKGYRKYSLTDFKSLDEARDFIVQNTTGIQDKYMLRLSEFETNVYGGSIMSSDDIVIAEMAEGLQTGVAYGTAQVVSGKLTSLEKSTKYSTEQKTERLLLWNAIKSLIRDRNIAMNDVIQHRKLHRIQDFYFLKGYFEFAYTIREDRADLRLIFFDVKLGEAYYNISAYN